MSKESSTWHSSRLQRDITLVRWGAVGAPVLLFATAGGDAEEVERFHLIEALGPLLEQGQIKVYSVDSIAGRVWFSEDKSPAGATRVQLEYDAAIVHEIVPAIRLDCRSPDAKIITAGASIGAFNALAALCRHPDLFYRAICMSGTYDPSKFFEGEPTPEWTQASPVHFLPKLPEGPHLELLRQHFAILAHGEGRWEEPSQSWRAAKALGDRGVPNRVDAWGSEWDHDWVTWRAMLPQYLREVLGVG